jgi:DNA-binding ferritin-like protein
MTDKSLDYRESLLPVFRDLRNFILLAEQAHWNVVGDDFYQLHLLFERLRDSNAEFVDRLAENMRSQFILVLNSPTYLMTSDVEFLEDPKQSGEAYLDALHAANRVLNESAECASKCCTECCKSGLVNMLGDLIEQVGKNYYLIESQRGLTKQPK